MSILTKNMNSKAITFFMIIIGILLIFNPKIAFATDIRGRIEGLSFYSKNIQPLRGVKVELLSCNLRCRVKGYTYTSSQGFYFFRNIRPGTYKIRINEDEKTRIEIFDQNFQDIPPIRIR